ncbi:unnamed protein product [Owenia fusiformis]|uniref:Leucine-rich repeat-containing protein 73 n=1 Tax=Owenia fusiformis TaxID=6347 RepID=A0A8S4PE91_OWEFU|nr:unnamed protein product [Owenia fusiformis]
MLLGSVQMCGETLSSIEVRDICESLETHSIRLLSLRECFMNDRDFQCLTISVGKCKSIMQLNLNLGLVSAVTRVEMLAQALMKNRTLTSLFIHGSPVSDYGMVMLSQALAAHPNIVNLDVGDCILGDRGLEAVAQLLPPDGAKPGLQELTLSANPAITSMGWVKFGIALAASSNLKVLNLDYNRVGDSGIACLTVALASLRGLEVLDLEGTGMTDQGAKMLLHLLENYPTDINRIILDENDIDPKLLGEIKHSLSLEETDENSSEKEILASDSEISKMSNEIAQTSLTNVTEISSEATSSMTLKPHDLDTMGNDLAKSTSLTPRELARFIRSPEAGASK